MCTHARPGLFGCSASLLYATSLGTNRRMPVCTSLASQDRLPLLCLFCAPLDLLQLGTSYTCLFTSPSDLGQPSAPVVPLRCLLGLDHLIISSLLPICKWANVWRLGEQPLFLDFSLNTFYIWRPPQRSSFTFSFYSLTFHPCATSLLRPGSWTCFAQTPLAVLISGRWTSLVCFSSTTYYALPYLPLEPLITWEGGEEALLPFTSCTVPSISIILPRSPPF